MKDAKPPMKCITKKEKRRMRRKLGGSEKCFGLASLRVTVGKNRSDSERKRWECEWRILGNPTEI